MPTVTLGTDPVAVQNKTSVSWFQLGDRRRVGRDKSTVANEVGNVKHLAIGERAEAYGFRSMSEVILTSSSPLTTDRGLCH